MEKPQPAPKIAKRPTTMPEDIASDLHNEEQGMQADGKHELPHTDDTHYDTHQGRGVSRFQKEADATTQDVREDSRSFVQEARSLRDTITSLNPDRVLKQIPEKVSILKNEWRPHLLSAIVRRIQAYKDLLTFTQNHQIDREAVYPYNTFNVFALLALIVVLEAIFNGFTLGLHQKRGFAEGAAIAFMFAATNIFLAWLAGEFCLRWTNCTVRRPRGLFLFTVSVLASLGLNAFLALYRDALVVTPTNLTDVYFAFYNLKLSFQNFLFMCVGFIAFCFATFKVYKSSDPFPGYADVDRRFVNASDDEQEPREEAQENVRDVTTDVFQELEELPNNADLSIAKMHSLADQTQNKIETGTTRLAALQNNAESWLLYVRGINSRVRHSSPPMYFQTLFPSFSLGDAGHAELKQITKFIDEATTHAKELRNQVAIAQDNRLSTLENSLDDFQQFINDLEEEAQKRSTNTQNIEREARKTFTKLQQEGA